MPLCPPCTHYVQVRYLFRIIGYGLVFTAVVTWLLPQRATSRRLQAELARSESFAAPTAIVEVGNTTYLGLEDGDVQFFGGIRYAMPPIGARRFASPEPCVEPVRPVVVDATRWSPICMQRPTPKRPLSDMSEDCMALNVFRPSLRPLDKLLPVVVWIYGSGFQSGSPIPYNGSAMIRRSIDLGTPVIFMSMSYRIGALSQPGDLALQDQALALSWMRENMAAFGGDKTQTTLAGQSAGALSIWHHVVRANSSDEVWWRGVAAESCALDSYPLYPPRIRAAYFHYFAAVAGCPFQGDVADMLACLRGIDEPSRLLQAHLAVMDAAHGKEAAIHPTPAVRLPEIGAYSRFPWKPSADAVPADWEVRLFDRLRGKSVLVSVTEDEGQLIVPKTAVHTDAEALSLLSHTFNSSARAERLWKLHDGSAQYRAARVLGDVWFHAPMRRLARELRAWYCLFDSRTEIVHHGGDLNALFYPEKGGVAFEMMDRWISFIAHGNPGDERWKTYPSALELNANPMPIPLWRVKEISAAEEVSLEIRAEVAES